VKRSCDHPYVKEDKALKKAPTREGQEKKGASAGQEHYNPKPKMNLT